MDPQVREENKKASNRLASRRRRERRKQDRDGTIAPPPDLKIKAYDPTRMPRKRAARTAVDRPREGATSTTDAVLVNRAAGPAPTFVVPANHQPAASRPTEYPPVHHEEAPIPQPCWPPSHGRDTPPAGRPGIISNAESAEKNGKENMVLEDDSAGLDGFMGDDEPLGGISDSSGSHGEQMDVDTPQAAFHQDIVQPPPVPGEAPAAAGSADALDHYRRAFPFGFSAVMPMRQATDDLDRDLIVLAETISVQLHHICLQIGPPTSSELQRILEEGPAAGSPSAPVNSTSRDSMSLDDMGRVATQWLTERGQDGGRIEVVCLRRSALFSDPGLSVSRSLDADTIVATHRVWVFDSGEYGAGSAALANGFLKVQSLEPQRLYWKGFSLSAYNCWEYIHPSVLMHDSLAYHVPDASLLQRIWDAVNIIREGSEVPHGHNTSQPWADIVWHDGDGPEELPQAPRQAAAQYILKILRTFPGCPAETHAEAASQHDVRYHTRPADGDSGSSRPAQPEVSDAAPARRSEEPRSECCSIPGITSTLRCGVAEVLETDDIGLPNWPASAMGLQAAFEGKTPSSGSGPPRLCMEKWHAPGTNSLPPYIVSFDHDSIMGFVKSLAVFRDNISLFADMYPEKNLSQNLHVTVDCPKTARGAPGRPSATTYKPNPIHLVPHYVAGNINLWGHHTELYFVFPGLYRWDLDDHRARYSKRQPAYFNTMRADDYRLWYEDVLRPALKDAINVVDAQGHRTPDPNLLNMFPRSYREARSRTTAPAEHSRVSMPASSSAEGQRAEQGIPRRGAGGSKVPEAPSDPPDMRTEETTNPSARRQHVSYPVQAMFLGKIQEAIHRIITRDNGDLKKKFGDFRIFVDSKNCKGLDMVSGGQTQGEVDGTFRRLGHRFWERFLRTFDPAYIDPGEFYVDIGKQFVARPAALTGGAASSSMHEDPQTFLWRKCCLDHMVKDRETWLQQVTSQAGRHRRPGLYKTAFRWFPYCTMGEAQCLTAVSSRKGVDRSSGWLASKYYNSNKNMFDAQKKYVFSAPGLSDLAQGDAYMDAHASLGGARRIDRPARERAYRQTKRRAGIALDVSRRDCWAIRHEETLTLRLFIEVLKLLNGDGMVSDGGHPAEERASSSEQGLPFFVVSTAYMCDFFRAQFNRHLHLFEYLYQQGRNREGAEFTIHQTVVMTIGLRLLPFCYSSMPTDTENVLFKSEWKHKCIVYSTADNSGSEEQDAPGSPGCNKPGQPSPSRAGSGVAENECDGCDAPDPRGQAPQAVRQLRPRPQPAAPLELGSGGGVGDAEEGMLSATEPGGEGSSASEDEETDVSLYSDSDPESKASSDETEAGDDRPPARRRHVRKQVTSVDRRGLGLAASMEKYGFGWWQPDILRWDSWDLSDDFLRELLNSNIIGNSRYGRTWKSVEPFTNGELLLSQALLSWPHKYRSILDNEECFRFWVDYLITLIIFFFRRDIWSIVLRNEARHPIFREDKKEKHSELKPPDFCWDSVLPLYKGRYGSVPPYRPHLKLRTGAPPVAPDEHVRSLFWGVVDSHQHATQFRTAVLRAEKAIGKCDDQVQFQREKPVDARQMFRTLLVETVIATHWLLPDRNRSSLVRMTPDKSRKHGNNRSVYHPCWISIAPLPANPRSNFWKLMQTGTDANIESRYAAINIHGRKGFYSVLRQSVVEEVLREGTPACFMPSNLKSKFDQEVLKKKAAKPDRRVMGSGATKTFEIGEQVHTHIVEAGKPPKLEAYLIISRNHAQLRKVDEWFRSQLTALGGGTG